MFVVALQVSDISRQSSKDIVLVIFFRMPLKCLNNALCFCPTKVLEKMPVQCTEAYTWPQLSLIMPGFHTHILSVGSTYPEN